MPDVIEHSTDAIGELPDAKPIPIRCRWLKRLLVCGGLLLLVLVAVRLWWGWEAHRRFQAEIDKCLAADEPMFPEDFNPIEPVPDDRNAAKFLIDAAAALTLTTDQEELIQDVLGGLVDVRERLDELERIEEANTRAFALVRSARSKPEVDWGNPIHKPGGL